MKNFFKYLLASILGVFISLFLIFIVFAGIFGAMIAAIDAPAIVSPNSVLHLTLNQQIVDRAAENPFEDFSPFNMASTSRTGLNDILENIKKAGKDENIKGIFLDLSSLNAGMATIGEIRDALIKFRETGKFVLSYADSFTQSAFYLASSADTVFMNPTGMIEFIGLRSEVLFLKGTLDKLGLEPQIIRHGKFKSAAEPLELEKMSDESRRQVMTYLNSLWGNMLQGISEQREISKPELNNIASNLLLYNAAAALDHGLVDGLKYRDEVLDELKNLAGIENEDDLRLVKLSRYNRVPMPKDFKGIARDKIAVIYATGNIHMGEGSNVSIGSEGISEAIRKARKDTTIKAIVLRVNSGGGSALASDIIWREAYLASQVKPLIASMGDVAASGGYYILAAADTIVASPSSITGSIGVFGLHLNMKRFMNEKIGITVDVAKTNPHADLLSPYRAPTASERAIVQKMVDDIYNTFVNRVSEGRDLTYEAVDNIGQGRVWSGTYAMEHGLVDLYGGLERAIEIAVEKSGVVNYRIVELPEMKDPIEELMKNLTGEARARILKNSLGISARYFEIIEQTLQYQGVQARLPFEIEVY